jgi:energy-coupling factor transporter ATP-binding protein EcfA2
MNGTAIVETPLSSDSLVEQIRKSLPDASEPQIQRFAEQVRRFEKVEGYFQEFPEDRQRYSDDIERAKKALNYEKPYRIAVIGATGAGKSTLINALLSESLVPTRDGQPATGTVLEIFLDAPQNGNEIALVTYRKEGDIRSLVQKLEQYPIDRTGLTSALNSGFAGILQRLEPDSNRPLNPKEYKEFTGLRDAIADIVAQYANHREKSEESFSLSNSREKDALKQVIDENSSLNAKNSISRRIGLVKSVTYHLKADRGSNGVSPLRLPRNVCLVDLPGLNGTTLHDIIISEGIVDADAVVFILRPNRILDRTEGDLITLAKKHISPKGSEQSGERIFIALNARDQSMKDGAVLSEDVTRAMATFMQSLVPGYATDPRTAKRGGETPYFLTSAWLADAAQKKLKGEPIEEPQNYDLRKQMLGINGNDDREVLKASQVPNLVKALMKFAQERRIEDKINDGEKSLSDIINALYRQYTAEVAQQSTVTESLSKKRNNELNDRLESARKVVRQFRVEQLQGFDSLRQRLEQEAKRICEAADQQVKQNMPGFWKSHYAEGFIENQAEYDHGVLYDPILGDAQVRLWGELNKGLPRIAEYLINQCQDNIARYKMAEKVSRECYECLKAEEIATKLEQFITESSGGNLYQMAQRLAMVQMTYPGYAFNARTKDGKPVVNPRLSEILANISPRLAEIVARVLTVYLQGQTGINLAPIINEIVMELTKLLMVAYQQDADGLTAFSNKGEPVYEGLYICLVELGKKETKETKESDFALLVAEMRKVYEPFVVSGCVDSFLNLYRYELLMIEKYLIAQVVEEAFEKLRSGRDSELRERIDQELAESNPDMRRQEALRRKLDLIQAIKGT